VRYFLQGSGSDERLKELAQVVGEEAVAVRGYCKLASIPRPCAAVWRALSLVHSCTPSVIRQDAIRWRSVTPRPLE